MQKIYCSQCHRSAFCDVSGVNKKYRKLWCSHKKKFIPLYAEIQGCPNVLYENKERYLSGYWKPAAYNNGKCTTS